MNHNPTAANNTRIATLMVTIDVSQRPTSLGPNAFTKVSTTTAATARDLVSMGEGAVVANVAA